MIRDEETGELIPSPSESIRATDWGYESIAAGGIPADDSPESLRAAKFAVEKATLLHPSIPYFTVSHLPWLVGAMAVLIVGAVLSAFLPIPFLILISLVLALLVLVLGPLWQKRQFGDRGVALSLDDPVLDGMSDVTGKSRRIAKVILRQYAYDQMPDDEALTAMDLLADGSRIADRAHQLGLGEDVDEMILATVPTLESVTELFNRLQIVDEAIDREVR